MRVVAISDNYLVSVSYSLSVSQVFLMFLKIKDGTNFKFLSILSFWFVLCIILCCQHVRFTLLREILDNYNFVSKNREQLLNITFFTPIKYYSNHIFFSTYLVFFLIITE